MSNFRYVDLPDGNLWVQMFGRETLALWALGIVFVELSLGCFGLKWLQLAIVEDLA